MTKNAEQELLITPADEKAFMEPKAAIVPTTPTPMEMISRALELKADPGVLERLMALYERWQAEQNRLKFDEALMAFKKDKPAILKTKQVIYPTKTGQASFKHPTLDDAIDKIDPELHKHGLSARWKPDTLPDGRVQVTCIISGFGHREEFPLAGPADNTGSKNALQAIGSAITYLQRYTLLPALGLAAAEDDDGKAAGGNVMDDIGERLEFIENCRNEDELRNVFHAAYKKARELNDQKSMRLLIEAKDKKRREFA